MVNVFGNNQLENIMGKESPFATSHRAVYKILSKIFKKYIGFIGEKKTA